MEVLEQKTETESLFLKTLGNSPTLRIIDFYLDNPLSDYSREEILDYVPISRNTLYQIWRTLEELEIVKPTRKIGKAVLYKLNRENRIVKRLLELDRTLVQEAADKSSELST